MLASPPSPRAELFRLLGDEDRLRLLALCAAEELTVGSFTTETRVKLLEALGAVLPKHLSHMQLYSGGTEAVEAAMRLAKSHTKKWEFLSFWGGFHGKTMGALSLMGSTFKEGLGPMVPGAHIIPYADCYRCPLALSHPSCGLACAEEQHPLVR